MYTEYNHDNTETNTQVINQCYAKKAILQNVHRNKDGTSRTSQVS